MIAYCA